jgi:hypothetical protein
VIMLVIEVDIKVSLSFVEIVMPNLNTEHKLSPCLSFSADYSGFWVIVGLQTGTGVDRLHIECVYDLAREDDQ